MGKLLHEKWTGIIHSRSFPGKGMPFECSLKRVRSCFMLDQELTKPQLHSEIAALNQKIAVLQKSSSEHKRAKQYVLDIEDIFSSMMEHTPIYVFIKDEETKAVRLSRNYEQMLGRPLNELLNKTVDELFPSDLAKSMAADDLRILNNNIYEKIEEELNGRIYSTIKFPIIAKSKNKYLAGFTIDITEQKKTEAKLQESVHRLRKALGTIIKAIASVVEARDPYTAGHQRRVADLARSIATEMNLQGHQIEGLRMASSIHDIGKIYVPAEILVKPTKLTTTEFALIKVHPQTGYDILKDIEFSCPVARIVLEHHERINGSGYPNGLRGENLLIESRILMVADVVESMASHRPYRPGLGIDCALGEIIKGKGTLFEPAIVDACVWLFHDKGYEFIGS
jgi:PAS domain S-box-containing protein